MMNNRGYILIVVLIAIIAILILSFYPASIDEDKQRNTYSVHSCETLTTGCKAKLENTEIEIKFADNIAFLKRFPIEVRVPARQQNDFDKVTVDFQMLGMNMGLNFYHLEQSDKERSLWTGEGVLPVCTTGRTDWQAVIALYKGSQVQRVAFRFKVNSATQ